MRLVIIEDDRRQRERLSLALNEEAGIRVVGSFETAEEALKSLERLSADVLLVDIGLPGLSGVELIRRARDLMPDVEMLAHTVFDDKSTIFSALKAGATGYILKGSRLAQIIEALHQVQEGGAPMTPSIARKVIREFQDVPSGEEDHVLTHRQIEIIKEIEYGLTYKQIAFKFNISPNTVNVHIKNIYQKLKAKDRQDALRSAQKKAFFNSIMHNRECTYDSSQLHKIPSRRPVR